MALRIKEVCKEKGTTLTELAEKMGIAQGNLSKMLNGNPTLETLDKVAEVLGVSTGELFEKLPADPNTITCPKCKTRFKMEE
ncbi:helix-turn-helix domain-containing protein [uncultured Parabacteroides sp.]|uniref:helix-turn-helix domain-containing protein n=1 Tax=uncultured Parabacteroides sp. TaxID=512312 RepID=UPI00265903CC|nr:helix-turn-helix transcriptional regulator [uncultured Parabacteroides sp.]